MKFYEELGEEEADTETFTEYSRRILKGGRSSGRSFRSSHAGGGGGSSNCSGDDCPAWWISVVIIASIIAVAFIAIRIVICINRCK